MNLYYLSKSSHSNSYSKDDLVLLCKVEQPASMYQSLFYLEGLSFSIPQYRLTAESNQSVCRSHIRQ